jgi:hypothetical protein
MNQLSILDVIESRKARDAGINLAVSHAEKEHKDWAAKAYRCLIDYLDTIKPGAEFQCEIFRSWAENKGLETPPSLRAYGHIFFRAKKENLITTNKTAPVSNKKANRANAAVWRKYESTEFI